MTTDEPSAGELAACPFCGGGASTMINCRGRWQTSCTGCHAGTPYAFDTRDLANIAWNTRASPSATRIREACDWHAGSFTFLDEPGEHDPCYVVMPGGSSLALNHHAGEGVDIARAKFIIDACNSALRFPPVAGAEVGVREALAELIRAGISLGKPAYAIAGTILSALPAPALSPPVAERGGGDGHLTVEDVYANCETTLIGFRDELTEQNIKFICDQISRKVMLATHPSTAPSPTPETGDGSETRDRGIPKSARCMTPEEIAADKTIIAHPSDARPERSPTENKEYFK